MKKIIVAGAAFVLIVFSPLSQSWAGGYWSSPGISFGINLGIPIYSKVWVPGHWERVYGDRVWAEGYWGKKRYAREYREVERRRHRARAYWVPNRWERRHGDRAWAAGYWKDKERPRDYYPSRKWDIRARDPKRHKHANDRW